MDSSSVSRNHARICQVGGEYVIFDNKSKYGTTIRDSKTYLKLDMTKKGVQIDRTILMMRIVRKNILEWFLNLLLASFCSYIFSGLIYIIVRGLLKNCKPFSKVWKE